MPDRLASNLLTVFRFHRWGSFARNEIVGRALAQDGEDAQPLRDLGAIDVWKSGTDGLVGKKKAFDPAARIIDVLITDFMNVYDSDFGIDL